MGKVRIHAKVAAILEVMWGSPSKYAPGWFRINPYNHSGSRLYDLLGHRDLWITNACDGIVSNPNGRGKPNPKRLRANLARLSFDLLLVCGRVAQKTLDQSDFLISDFDSEKSSIVFMPHPASRNWSLQSIRETRELIRWASQEPGRITSTYEKEDV